MEQLTINITPADGGYIVTVYEKGVDTANIKPHIFFKLEDVHAFLTATVSEPAPESEVAPPVEGDANSTNA